MNFCKRRSDDISAGKHRANIDMIYTVEEDLELRLSVETDAISRRHTGIQDSVENLENQGVVARREDALGNFLS